MVQHKNAAYIEMNETYRKF